MKLDKYQQMVTECNSNAVVSAGAGSGKTTVLARRFLRLIDEGLAEVSEILTLTFTRKAAAEMYERIYRLLLDNRTRPAVSRAVSDFDKANISTLDSFCSRVARDCSNDFGLSSGFKTDEAAVLELATDVSLDFILKNKENSFLEEFIFINGFENVWKNFFVEISMRYLSLGMPRDFQGIFQAQMAAAEAELSNFAMKLDRIVSELNSLDSDLKGVAAVRLQLESYVFGALPSDENNFDGLRKNLAVLNVKKPGGRSESAEFIMCKELIDELRPAAETVRELIETLEARELIEGLFKLTAAFQDELFSRKRSAGVVGFQDVLTIAVTGLKQNKELRKYYKGLFKFIMIDEFQDNNGLQKELLYLLAEKDGNEGDGLPSASDLNSGKLFFVGDEKQSIYRFRGADVSVFKQLSGELSESGGVSLSLKKNYRSEPVLIDFFNRVFSHVMKDSSEDYQATFEPLEYREASLTAPPDIKLLYKPYEDDLAEDVLSAEESEAMAIADYVLAGVGQLEVNGENGSDRPRKAEFSDFAMLYRSGGSQKTYEKVFRARGIPYSVHSIRSLFLEAPVNDLYNFLQLCIYPEDKAASAAFMRSPIINLSDFSVVRIILSGKPVFAEGQEQLCRSAPDLQKYQAAKELYEVMRSRIDRDDICRIVSDLWYLTGYRYLILSDPTQHGYLEYFAYFRQLAVKADRQRQSMAEFLDYVRENLGAYQKVDDLKILGYSSEGVQMMPIHQAKGLEFPVVIIANTGNTGLNDSGGSSPAYISEKDGLSFNLVNPEEGVKQQRNNYFFSRGKEENRAKEDAELRRLLYVALTRAKNHLVISGCHGRMNRRGERAMLNIVLSSLGWGEGTDPEAYPDIAALLGKIRTMTWKESLDLSRNSSAVEVEKAAEYYESAQICEYSIRQTDFSASGINAGVRGEAERDEPPEGRVLKGLQAGVEELVSEKGFEADFGTLCHGIIEWRINHGTAPAADTPDAASEMLRPGFRMVDEKSWEPFFSAADGLAKAFFYSGIWKKAAGAISVESELPFTALRNYHGREVYVKGVIDLLIETGEEIILVDFKTDRRIIPGEYDTQMRIYMDAASELFGKPVRCSLFYLREGVELEVIL